MNEEQIDVKQYDHWLKDDSDIAALVMRQWLTPVEGKDAVIFPPTYAKPERMPDGEWTGYNIDEFDDGSSVCQIDSVGSQANRMEPIFLRKPYSSLVPQIVITAGDKQVNLLEAGHRAADAIVRFSSLKEELVAAFKAAGSGDACKLAKVAPTSLVFGAWDSRDTQVKLPRIVRSVIRAYHVQPLHRSAQYIPAVDYVEEGLLGAPKEKKQQDAMSQLGLNHAPAPWTHGGVIVNKEIRRDATLNLVALRALGTGSNNDPLPLRRYILGLSLISFTATQDGFLREGCHLVPDINHPAIWTLTRHDGQREDYTVSPAKALEYAKLAANDFGVGEAKEADFGVDAAGKELNMSKEERKKSKRKQDKKAETESQP